MLLLDRASLDHKVLSICEQYYQHRGKPGCSLGRAMEEETCLLWKLWLPKDPPSQVGGGITMVINIAFDTDPNLWNS